jgi:hypothetical protein
MNGGIYFREFMGADFLERNVGGFAGGVLVIFLGVFLLAPKQDVGKASPLASAAGLAAGPAAAASTTGGGGDRGGGLQDLRTPGKLSRSTSSEGGAVRRLAISEVDRGLDDLDRQLRIGTPALAEEQQRVKSARRHVSELLEEAQQVLFGDESAPHFSYPGAISRTPGYDAATGIGRLGSGQGYKPRLVSFVGELPVLLSHKKTVHTFEHLIPTFDGMHDSDDEVAEAVTTRAASTSPRPRTPDLSATTSKGQWSI